MADALLREECKKNIEMGKKLFKCFVDIKKAFDRVPRKVMPWAMTKKSLPEVTVRAVMSLYQGRSPKLEWD